MKILNERPQIALYEGNNDARLRCTIGSLCRSIQTFSYSGCHCSLLLILHFFNLNLRQQPTADRRLRSLSVSYNDHTTEPLTLAGGSLFFEGLQYFKGGGDLSALLIRFVLGSGRV